MLELLVALGVLALCAALLFEGLHFSGRLWAGFRRRAEAVESVASAQQFLRARIELLEPFHPPSSGDTPHAVIGTADGLEFSAPPPDVLGAGSLRYQVRVRATRVNRDLLVRWRRDWDGRIDPVAGADWHEEVLIANIDAARFDYLDRNRAGEPAWQPTWTDVRAPSAIRLAIRFPASDDRRWSRFVVRPSLDDDPVCEFDVVSRRCRE